MPVCVVSDLACAFWWIRRSRWLRTLCRSAMATIRGKISDPVPVTELRRASHEHTRHFIRENRFGGAERRT